MTSFPKLSEENIAQLRLARTEGIGPVTYRKLLTLFTTPESALHNLPDLYRSKGKAVPKIPSEKTALQEVEDLQTFGGTMLFHGEENYPAALAAISDPPIVLSVLGTPQALHGKQLAVVGNRNASAAAVKLTHILCAELAAQNLTITSGLARGIDTAAHNGTLSAADGKTVAVVAGGVNFIYPPENKELYLRIIQNGCVVSEAPLGTAPTQQHFPRRNRIIAGLSLGTLVVEAPKPSGSLITAEYALEQGREVFAIPGSPSDARASGPNSLLKEGAHMVEDAADILAVLDTLPEHGPTTPQKRPQKSSKAASPTQKAPQPSLFENPAETGTILPLRVSTQPNDSEEALSPKEKLLSLLSPTPTPLDELIQHTGLPSAILSILLTELDIEGKLTQTAHGYARS